MGFLCTKPRIRLQLSKRVGPSFLILTEEYFNIIVNLLKIVFLLLL